MKQNRFSRLIIFLTSPPCTKIDNKGTLCCAFNYYRAAHSDGDGSRPGDLVRADGADGEGPGDVGAELDADADGHDEVDEGDGVQLDAPPVHQTEHVRQDHHDHQQDHQGGTEVHA